MQSDRAGAVQTHIGQLFLTLVFKPRKCKKIEMVADSRRGHLGHILDKGGTGAGLGG